MSIPVILLVQEAAQRIEDTGYAQVSLALWQMFLNRIQRDIALRCKMIERQAIGPMVLDERYPYPDDLVQLTKVEFTRTPSNMKTYARLYEKMKDEMDALTDGNYPTGDPECYLARPDHFQLDKIPADEIVDAFRVTYWALPDEITDVTIDEMTLPELARDHIVEGLIIAADYKRGEHQRAAAAEREWLKREEFIADPLYDRSDDRRSNLRPRSLYDPYGDQV